MNLKSETHSNPHSNQGPKGSVIQKMFDEISPKYDMANDVLSLKTHHLWRKKLVEWSEIKPGDSVLDCATGTGDLAFAYKSAVGETGTVLGTDFSAGMLSRAEVKAEQNHIDVAFSLADMTALAFADNTFDVVSVSFGIRNVENRSLAIEHLHRVLKPGGKLMILEFGQPKNRWFRSLYSWYSQNVLPKLGGMLSGKFEAYHYLQDSSAKFPCAAEFLDFMQRSAPFESLEYRPLSMGIAYMYKGTKK